MAEALSRRNYVKASQIQSEITRELQRRETTSLGSLLPDMTREERVKVLCLMHKLFVFSDILYGSALEFSEYLKRFDKSIDVEVVKQAKEASRLARELQRT